MTSGGIGGYFELELTMAPFFTKMECRFIEHY